MKEILIDYITRQLRFVNAEINDILDERNDSRYWEGYQDALKAFSDKVKNIKG